jgi:hypothetical protein
LKKKQKRSRINSFSVRSTWIPTQISIFEGEELTIPEEENIE